MRRTRGARLTVAAVVAALALVGAACTEDNPQQELSCDFYEQQVETGAIEAGDPDIPEDCRDQVAPDG